MNPLITQLDAVSLFPEVHDDYVQTPAGETVVVYPFGTEVDLAARGWELSLLNDPQGGVATVTSAGAVKFAPNPGFVGAATIHFVGEDQQSNDCSATITVEVQNQFAFNAATSINNSGTVGTAPRLDRSNNATGFCALKIFAVVTDPVFAGTAAPGAELVGRLYNQCGALAGESTATVNTDGQWEMLIPDTRALEFYRFEVEQLATANGTFGKIALHPDEAGWQAM